MDNHKVVCFVCLTPYHVFVSYLLSKTVYKNNYKIIMLSNYNVAVERAYKNSNKLNLWNEIILIKERKESSDFVREQLNDLDFKNIDILHYFSWGSRLCSNVMNYVLDETKIILTDEGVMTYVVKEAYKNWTKKYKDKKNPLDFHKISEIWLFDKRLYVSKLKKPLKNIEFKKYLDSNLKFELCNDLNILFDYKHKKNDYNLVFFDQYLALAQIITSTEEKHLLINILQTAENLKVLIKNHPRDSNDKYTGLNIDIFKDKDIPWEVIYLNEYIKNKSKIKNKIYMTYSSAAMLNNRILFKDFDTSNNYILLNKLLLNFTNNFEINVTLKKFLKKFKKLYGMNFHEITTFSHLNNVLNNISKK
ncbi:hypothetical protein IZY60_11495 [Lutibacter sp. B2]|nr:hypothetical protein [Lutibacter sp. B2]